MTPWIADILVNINDSSPAGECLDFPDIQQRYRNCLTCTAFITLWRDNARARSGRTCSCEMSKVSDHPVSKGVTSPM